MNQKHLTPLFVRKPINAIKSKYFFDKMKNILHVNNLLNWSRKQTIKYLSFEYEVEYLSYRFSVLKEWIYKNQIYQTQFVNNLQTIISNLLLDNMLTTQEKNFIEDYRSVVFAKTRNIKNLIVDFELEQKEEVWYVYDVFAVYLKNNTYELVAKNIQIFLSNLKTIFASDGKIYNFIYNNEIQHVKLHNNMLVIITNEQEFYVVADQITTIYVSFERLARLAKLDF